MLKFTKRLDYSVVILTHLSQRQGASSSAKEIAEQYRLSPSLVASLLKKLARVGFVVSTRGKHGGYQLGLPPARIRLGEVVRVIEGEFNLTACTSPAHAAPAPVSASGCTLLDICPSRTPIQRLHHKIYHFLEVTTLEEIAFPNGQPAAPAAAMAR